MKIPHSSTGSSEMSMAISNSLQDFTSGKVSREEGLEAIDSAISKALTEGISATDILSLSQEALQMVQKQTSFTMRTEKSIEAEKASGRPQGLIEEMKAYDAMWNNGGMPNVKQLQDGMKSHEVLFEELNEMSKEEAQQALEELAQKLKDESVLAESLENAKDTPVRDTGVKQDSEVPTQDSSKAPSQDSGSDSGDNSEAVITSDKGDYEPTISTGSKDNAEPVITKPSGSSNSEPEISTGSSGDSDRPEARVRTAKKPPAPSIDVIV